MITTKRRPFCSLLILFLPLGLALLPTACGRKLPVQEADKAVLLGAQDLVEYGYGFKAIQQHQTYTKSRFLDGTYEVEYEFATPEGETENPLFMYVVVSVNAQRSDAQISQGTEKIALLVALNAQGIKEEEVENFYHYGDSSSFYLLKKEGKPIGNYFTARQGKKTYTLILSGMYFNDPQVWKELVEPKLKQFSAYKPG